MRDEIDLNHFLDILLRRRWVVIASTVIVFLATILVTYSTRRVYQAETLLIIEKERETAGQTGSMVENSNDDYYQTQYKLLQSNSLLSKVYRELSLEKTEDFSQPNGVGRLKRAIKIFPITRSRLVYVRTESHDPTLAAQVSNRLSETFVEQNVANQLFISKEVLQALQMKEGTTSYDSLPAVVNNQLIQSLRGDYAKLQSQHAEMKQRYTDKYPAMAALKSNLDALDAQIRAETQRIVASLKTELSGQLKGNNVRVIDPAEVPTTPIRPKKLMNLLLGLGGGLILGLSLGFFVETLDQSIRAQNDIEEKLRQPFLGVLPQAAVTKGRSYAPLMAKNQSLSSEAFRNIRTMVDFAGIGGGAKALLVTSTLQGEGKTYVASGLAVAIAQLGERVLLIDGDLRRPRLHTTFGVSSERGLSEYLLNGRHAEEAAASIQDTDVPGLSVMPCGTCPPNPSELLNTPRLGALVAWARGKYDRVMIDCTPMYPINDTLLWGRTVPSCIFIVRYGATRIPLVLGACQKLQAAGIKVLGVGLNAATAGGLSYAPYGYYAHQYYQQPQRESGVA